MGSIKGIVSFWLFMCVVSFWLACDVEAQGYSCPQTKEAYIDLLNYHALANGINTKFKEVNEGCLGIFVHVARDRITQFRDSTEDMMREMSFDWELVSDSIHVRLYDINDSLVYELSDNGFFEVKEMI